MLGIKVKGLGLRVKVQGLRPKTLVTGPMVGSSVI